MCHWSRIGNRKKIAEKIADKALIYASNGISSSWCFHPFINKVTCYTQNKEMTIFYNLSYQMNNKNINIVVTSFTDKIVKI